MLNRIIQQSIQHKWVVLLGVLGLILWGGYSAYKLPVDAVPDITNNQVQIITNAPTLAAQEVEQLITYPLEQQMANLPTLEEMRSISRFGLSVITLVFAEKTDVYFARQLINERLARAGDAIDPRLGKPVLAPVSTGLGEVYQYILRARGGYEQKFTPMELRSLQDWVVARQLYGIPGVAEVNSFGGYVKQYEVAVEPARLRATNVTMAELFAAVAGNNENTGGAYIDKKPYAYFIRGVGMVKTKEDIEQTVVKASPAGIPVLVRDLAQVKLGHAARYGAVSFNGQKEVVSGIVMMLKGANGAEVIEQINQRLPTIRSSLPEGVVLEPYLDRTDLIDRAIGTVEKNLLEGALIVLAVLIVFLGNLRAGLIVASVIPLSMLFALAMMRLFGVSANLMSLGAIDFGLIVDGSLIIVEATMHHLGLRKTTHRLSQKQMDEEVYHSAAAIRNSAAFGELIILIVYLPILMLVGIEGKMFKPMAQTVSFAIIGALLLSLTYVPVASSLFLPKTPLKENFSDRLVKSLQTWYKPLLVNVLRFKRSVVAATLAATVFAGFLFARMGSEFLPQLQEGDYAFHCILPQGSSLSQSVDVSMHAARIIKTFPEVRAVIGKTGTAELPTDPMPPEATDMIITLKPKSEWTTADDYMVLADTILKKLSIIPGIFFEYSQPIQMRFNELMTGVKQDVAVKIFGENIDTLAMLAPKVAQIIQSIEGTAEAQIEATTGLPQMVVNYHRDRMAVYGLQIADVNRSIRMAFAGEVAGMVYENERRYDLVIRLDSSVRTDLSDVQNLLIATPAGNQIPLNQVAEVAMKEGPAQITREMGKRRIVIGFNLEGRDVQSVVQELQSKLRTEMKLPPGYYFVYGGTFENLEAANDRLMIAVPAALALVFGLLYLTFRSWAQATLIFTAIPMSAIGGVLALLFRGMPFSVSAGVGFVALFGVAVLNGIVLISTFNQLKKEGVSDLRTRVLEGCLQRLRPILMTATVASLGFLPMALSTSDGAEVQRPLATVVIGGLLSATFLTLFVLPCLYWLVEKWQAKRLKPAMAAALMLIGLCCSGTSASAQPPAALENLLKLAEQNNRSILTSEATIQKGRLLVSTANDFAKSGVFVENEDARPSDRQGILKIGLAQTIAWPGLYKARRQLFAQQLSLQQLNRSALQAVLRREVSSGYYNLWFLRSQLGLLVELDSIAKSAYEIARLRARTGDVAGLDSIAAEAAWREMEARIYQQETEVQVAQVQLAALLNDSSLLAAPSTALERMPAPQLLLEGLHPVLAVQNQQVAVARADVRVQQNHNKPDLSGRLFTQRLWGARDPFSGFSFMASIPLFNAPAYRAKVQAARAEQIVQERVLQAQQLQWQTDSRAAVLRVQKQDSLLRYYETRGLRQASSILSAATLSYRAGEISFAELNQFLRQVVDIRQNHLQSLHQYNLAVIELQYQQASIRP